MSDYVDQLLWVIAVSGSELHQLFGLGEHGAALGGPGHVDAAPAAELQESFVPQQPQGSQHRVGVDLEHGSKVAGGRQPLSRGCLALGDRAADLARDLVVEQDRSIAVNLDFQHRASDTSVMWETIERPWAPSRWAVIKDARRRQRRRHRRIVAVAAALLVAAAAGWAIASNSRSGHAPQPPPVTVGTFEQLRLGGVVQDTTTLGANLWVLTCLRRCSQASSTASAGELIELTASGRPIRRLPVADPTALTAGAGEIWIAHVDTGDISRINPQTGQTTATVHLQFPKPIATGGWRRFEPSGISFGAGRVWASSPFGYVDEINPRTPWRQRMVFTSSEVTSATTGGGLTWVADELDGVGTFPAGSDHVATHHISWARQPVDVETVAPGAGLIWALGTQTSYLTSLTDPTTVGVLTTLDPRTGRIMHQWRVSPETTMVLGNGGAYVGDDSDRRLLRLTPPHGVQTLHGPKGARLTAATPDALWAISRNGQLVRIGLTRR